MKSYFILILILLAPVFVLAQDEIPDFSDEVPGSLSFDLGFNFLPGVEKDAEIGFWGSKTARIYYQYEMPIMKSGFTFNPGIGISDERYAFDGPFTLVDSVGSNAVELIGVDQIFATPTNPIEVTKSKFSALYLDIPVELRWHLDKNNLQKSFKLAIGARGGIRLGGKTKVKFNNADGDTRIVKVKEDFELTKFRFGVYGRMGLGSFSIYYYQSITELFEKDKGPIEMNNAIPWQVGVTYEIF
jgi:outer membrane protein with beta-barrel domain